MKNTPRSRSASPARDADSTPHVVVGIGASAGGLEVFRRLLPLLPTDAGFSFILVQHLDPERESVLTELLAPCTEMAVREAEQGDKLSPNTVYVIPPGADLCVVDGKLELSEPVLHRGLRLPVNRLFTSLAREFGARSVGIVLSGAGSDGTLGLRDIQASGGLTIAQEPGTSQQKGMPGNAIQTGSVSRVLEVDAIPEVLTEFASGRDGSEAPPDPAVLAHQEKLDDDQLAALAELLDGHDQFDLRCYKTGTIHRRLQRRVILARMDSVEAYLERLRSDREEQRALIDDLLISVTDFFRDPEAFSRLRELVVLPLVDAATRGDVLRVWVAGCATGEEAYSLAIEFFEAFERAGKRVQLQLFATDIDDGALAHARRGLYPDTIESRVSEERLRRYFTWRDGLGFEVDKAVRECVSFARHDLTRDPPFSRLDLVSCRNVLIYLTPEAQARVLESFHFSLNSGGHLFLGTSEDVGARRPLFSTESKKCHIFKKLGESATDHAAPTGTVRELTSEDEGQPIDPEPRQAVDKTALAQRVVMDERLPPTLVISGTGSVLFMHGELRPYLRFPEGPDPRLEFATLIAPKFASRTRAALYKCRRSQETVSTSVDATAEAPPTLILATPSPALGEGAVILSFTPMPIDKTPHFNADPSAEQELVIDELSEELLQTRTELQGTVEKLQSSNEQLRLSNEESMSMNEEMQATNEELEATTEELRSLNEELSTVNNQLREKVEQLAEAHDDLNNFITSAKLATIFLDEKLHLKKFTPAAEELLGLEEADIGRAIGSFNRKLLGGGLESEAATVLEHFAPFSDELQTRDGRWFARQVLPYRTGSRRVEGVVVTLVDVTELKSATERLAIRERQQAAIARLGLRALKEPDLASFMDQTVREIQQTLSTDFCKILELQPGDQQYFLRAGVGWNDGLVGEATVSSGADSQAGFTRNSADPVIVEDLATEKRFSGPELLLDHGVVSGLSCVIRDENEYGVLGAHTRTRRIFSHEDAIFLQSVATVLGSAIGRHQNRVRLSVERGISIALSKHRDVHEALKDVFECFGREMDVCDAEFWRPDVDAQELHCEMTWSRARHRHEAAAAAFSARTFASGEGLVGCAFEEQRAIWVTDLGERGVFVRRDAARELGLFSGFAFPVVAGFEQLGVVTVFSRQRLLGGDQFLRSLEAFGRSIGEFIVRLDVEENARRLAAITESSHDAILSYDFDGTITDWLGGAEALYGYSAAEIVGTSVEHLVPVEVQAQLRETIARIRRGEVPEPIATVRRRKDGSVVDVSSRCSPIKSPDGKLVGVSSNDRDVTRQKLTERKLLAANEQKDEFLAMLGHELRNPLAAIRSATELLKLSGPTDPVMQRTHAILERQSAHMARLLDGLLDVSRIIRGKIALEPAVVDLVEICRELVEDIASRIASQNLEFNVELPSAPLWIDADRVRITQVVDNLLSNAVKYNRPGGTITLSLRADNGSAELRVRDTGVGIAPELLPAMFEVFRQAKQTIDRSYGGLGLGLALVKSLVELHGGEVVGHSDGLEQGAEFIVTLPLADSPPIAANRPSVGDGGIVRILVIEDNVDAADMLRTILELSGHEVETAHTGPDGIELATELLPDLILCDLGLPDGVSGFDVARALRESPQTRHVRLVALSGYGRPEDKERARQAGFDAHLTKPADMKMIERLLIDFDLREPNLSAPS